MPSLRDVFVEFVIDPLFRPEKGSSHLKKKFFQVRKDWKRMVRDISGMVENNG